MRSETGPGGGGGVGALTMGVQRRLIDEICAGERSITAETAVRPGLVFGIEPEFWLKLQAQYDVEMISANRGSGWRRSAPLSA